MPARSIKQRNLMAAAEHGAKFPMARKIASSMSHQSMHDFASTTNAEIKANRGIHPSSMLSRHASMPRMKKS